MKTAALLLGPIAAVICGVLMHLKGFSPEASVTLGLVLLCIAWWLFEPIPIAATAMLPLFVFPLTGVLTESQIANAYADPIIILLLGGFMLSTTLEKSGAHQRLAVGMVRLFGGTSSRRIVFGFMAAAALLSMWISNTATTLMLLPVALAVVERTRDPNLPAPLLIGVAYAANIGGIGTPIGTPANLIFMGVYQNTTGHSITFWEWMTWGVPVILVFLPLSALWLARRCGQRCSIDLPQIGPWRTEERRTLIVFALTVVLWITREVPFGGWQSWFALPHATDAIVAIAAVVAMFILPNGHGGRLVDWQTAERIPWGVLIMFGGGIAIADAFVSTGLSQVIGHTMAGLGSWPPYLLMLIVALSVTFLSETTSNAATASVFMPVLAAAAPALGMDPRVLMVPAAMAASYSFMLPVGSAPNLIVYGTGHIPTMTMVREGFVLNLAGAVVITTLCYAYFLL